MMLFEPNRADNRQWKMLLIYHIYRMVGIVFLFAYFWFSLYSQALSHSYSLMLLTYFIFGLMCFYFWFYRVFKFDRQILWCGTIDIIMIVLFIDLIGYLALGLGIILYATIVVLSILKPGIIAIYFASIASLMLLIINAMHYEYGFEQDLMPFFTTGIYGAGFFATALTTCYLAGRIRSSELIAEQWSNELISILRIGEHFIEQFKNGVIYVESEGKVRLLNNAVRQYFNIKKSTNYCALEQLLPQIYPQYLAFVSKQHKKRANAKFMINELNLQIEFFSVSIDSKTSVLIIIEDRHDIEQQAQQFKLASLGRFSASIAHELRNPLGIISHAVQLMGEEKALDKESMRLKELIINNCNRMNKVIKNVLQLSRQQPSNPEEIALIPFLKSFKYEYTLINRCKIMISAAKNSPTHIWFDKSQLDQILVNLCDNAMLHGANPEGEVEINLSVDSTRRYISLKVYDTGVGIPESKKHIVFEPFFTTLVTGNGMGLFIAKDLCELNGAHLSLIPVEQGCCFSIQFNHQNEILL